MYLQICYGWSRFYSLFVFFTFKYVDVHCMTIKFDWKKRCQRDRKGSKQVCGQARDYNTDLSHKTHHPVAAQHIKIMVNCLQVVDTVL